MPNTPAQIGQGMTAWTATPQVNEAQLAQVRAMLGALGKEMYVETERMVDMATALSATVPTYIFLVREALVDAGVHMGFRGMSLRNWFCKPCWAQCYLPRNHRNIRLSCATWSPRRAVPPPKQSIRWRKV